MRKVVFPYFVGIAKGESSDGEVEIELTDEEYDEIKAAADAAGEKVNTFIKNAIWQRMGKEEYRQ